MLKKIISALSVPILLFSVLPVSANAIEYADSGEYFESGTYLRDEADVLDTESERKLFDYLEKTASKIDMNVAIYFSETNRSADDTKNFAEQKVLDLFHSGNSVLYYIDCSENYGNMTDWIATTGTARLYYNDSSQKNKKDESTYGNRIDYIMYDNDQYLTQGSEDYLSAGMNYADNLVYFYNKGVVDGTYYKGENGSYYYVKNGEIKESMSKPHEFSWITFGISAGVFVLMWLILFFSIKSQYKFKTPANASVYTGQDKINYTQVFDTFLRTHTTRVRIRTENDNNSSGGGSSGGGSVGGGGHSR